MPGFTVFLFLSALLLSIPGRAQTNPFENEIRAFEQRDAQNPPPQNSILFIGSSSIVRWETLALAFPAYQVLNRGFGGSQASDVLYFYDRIVRPYHPPLIVYYEGDNDLAGGRTVDRVFSDWTNFVARVERDLPDTHLLYIAVKPSPSRAQFLPLQVELNERVREFNSRDPRLHFADVFHALLDSAGKPRADLVVSDQLHLNAAGYAIWESVIVPEVERWAERYPVEVRAPQRGAVWIDFGAAENPSGGQTAGAVYWNNVTTTTGATDSATLSNLVTIRGVRSTATLRMLSRFNGANENGTLASTLFPSSATRDSLFGNTETFSGLANIRPRFQVTGLKPAASYRVEFYASRLGVADNRQTRYIVTGVVTNSADLNAANNVDAVAVLNDVAPDAGGNLTIALLPAPANNNANHFTYLGVLRLTPLSSPDDALIFDFGATGSPTLAENSNLIRWNDLTPEVATTPAGRLPNLLTTNAAASGIDLLMLSPFNGPNLNGTAFSTNFPATATQDSLFGNEETFNGLTGVMPEFKLIGLDPAGSYRLTFYASRIGVNDNRETLYTIEGSSTLTAVLDAANNTNAFAVVDGVRASANGEIAIKLTASPRNNSPNHFTYLGLLQVDWTVPPAAPASLLEPRPAQDGLEFLLRGQAGSNYILQVSTNLTAWTDLRPVSLTAASERIVVNRGAGSAYYRVIKR